LQLQGTLSRHVVEDGIQTVTMPAQSGDAAFIDASRQPPYQDVLVQHHGMERCLSILAARRENRLKLDAGQEAEWEREWAKFQRNFPISATVAPLSVRTAPRTVTLVELRRFLRLPAEALLKRHLRLEEDDEPAAEDDEPLVTPRQVANSLTRTTIRQLVLATTRGELDQALADWPRCFGQAFADARLCSRVPEEAFGEIDQAALLAGLSERIRGSGQIERFLRERAAMAYCGPVLLGESLTPLGAKLRFPALRLRPDHELPADAPHEIRLVGYSHYAWHSPRKFEILVVTNRKEIVGRLLCDPMFDPLLLYLALLAGSEPNADGIISSSWLANREFVLHVAHREGIATWSYPPGDITSAEALRYLVDLARDFLDPAQFDLLPFDTMMRSASLRLALQHDPVHMSAEVFRGMLVDSLNDQRENARSPAKVPLLVEMAQAAVPADALAKVRRRFPLLDRGPARVRRPKTKLFAVV
jgi:hypothetical protein